MEDPRWIDAAEIADRLRIHTGLGFRLPSETEWEYACRAGTTSRYYFGESYGPSLPDSEVIGRRLKPVGSIDAPNRYGLHDMYSPVGSWCNDWAYPDYSYTPVNGILEGDFPDAAGGGTEEVEVYLDDSKATVVGCTSNEILATAPLDLVPGTTVKLVVRAGFQSTAPRDVLIR